MFSQNSSYFESIEYITDFKLEDLHPIKKQLTEVRLAAFFAQQNFIFYHAQKDFA